MTHAQELINRRRIIELEAEVTAEAYEKALAREQARVAMRFADRHVAIGQEIARLQAEFARLPDDQRREEELGRARVLDQFRSRHQAVLAEVARIRSGVGAEADDGRWKVQRTGKPKKQWGAVAKCLALNPQAGYDDLAEAVFGRRSEAAKSALRPLIYAMRKFGVLEGNPGAWRLLCPAENVQWLKL